jgi:hypothetical protein
MPSQIDLTMPVTGAPTTLSVRTNFATAAAEISALQAALALAPYWITAGGSFTIPDGTARAFVNASAPVTLTLPHNDVIVADRGGFAGSYPIAIVPPAGCTINGQPGFALVNNWDTARFIYDGTNFGFG